MAAEYVEDAGVLGGEQGVERVDIGFDGAAELELSAFFAVGADVEFGYVDVVDDAAVVVNRGFEEFAVGVVDVVVSLHADAVDGDAACLHPFHHLADAFALHGVGFVVVVVEKEGVGVGFVGVDEGFFDEFLACDLVECGGSVGIVGTGVVGDGFVDDVPAVDDVAVAADDGVDVPAHPLQQFFLGGLSVFAFKHPTADLVVPDEAVSAHAESVLAAEIGDAVGCVPAEVAFGGFGRFGLHVVFRRDAVVVLHEECRLQRVGYVALVDGDAHFEESFVGIFESVERLLCMGDSGGGCDEGCAEGGADSAVHGVVWGLK